MDWVTTFPFGHIFQDSLGGENIVGHPSSNGDVVVGNDVWIGSGATLMSGVSIGNGAVIAANAHVVSDVEPYAIVGGNPAKHLKFRFDKEIRNLLLELRWWDLDEATIREIAPEISQPPEVQTLRNLIERHAGAN
ncbi:MAG: CatB-related O-acetyltransferase [Pseudomonadota bacterium]